MDLDKKDGDPYSFVVNAETEYLLGWSWNLFYLVRLSKYFAALPAGADARKSEMFPTSEIQPNSPETLVTSLEEQEIHTKEITRVNDRWFKTTQVKKSLIWYRGGALV